MRSSRKRECSVSLWKYVGGVLESQERCVVRRGAGVWCALLCDGEGAVWVGLGVGIEGGFGIGVVG